MTKQYKFWFEAAMMQKQAGNTDAADRFFAMAMLYSKS